MRDVLVAAVVVDDDDDAVILGGLISSSLCIQTWVEFLWRLLDVSCGRQVDK